MKTYFYTVFSPVFDLDVTVSGKTRKVNPGEALVLSLLASVTQHGDGSWHGGQAELAAATGMPERTARAALAVLVEAGYVAIRKETVLREGSTPLTTTYYTCLVNFETKATREEAPKEAPQEAPQVSSEEATKEPTPAPSKKTKADDPAAFVAAVVSLGVSKETATDWAATRKKANASFTATANKLVTSELQNCIDAGVSAEDAALVALENSWRGIKAEWVINRLGSKVAAQQAPQYKEAHITF